MVVIPDANIEEETTSFDAWLRFAGRCIVGRGLIESLNTMALLVKRAFDVCIWFAEIEKKGWSYLAGTGGKQPRPSDVFRTPLGKDLGMVCDTWGYLSPAEQNRLVVFLEHLVVSKTELKRWGVQEDTTA